VPPPRSKQPPARIQIQHVEPVVDCGRFALKRVVGERVDVYASIFKDGHDVLGASVRVKPPGATRGRSRRCSRSANDRWRGGFIVDAPGRWSWRIDAWTDRVPRGARRSGARTSRTGRPHRASCRRERSCSGATPSTVEEALAVETADRHGTTSSATFEIDADRLLGRFGAWYELFPRSWGGFRGVAEALPELAALGFDVVYLPPVHPIGHTNRKGRNNTLTPGPDDVGSPWAIGDETGGHDALHPDLGTWDDFDAMLAAAKEAGSRSRSTSRSSARPTTRG
jgi:starch synthase (maltosyl-transferring)